MDNKTRQNIVLYLDPVDGVERRIRILKNYRKLFIDIALFIEERMVEHKRPDWTYSYCESNIVLKNINPDINKSDFVVDYEGITPNKINIVKVDEFSLIDIVREFYKSYEKAVDMAREMNKDAKFIEEFNEEITEEIEELSQSELEL